MILRHAAALRICQAEVVLGARVSRVGRLAPPARRLTIVAGYALPARIHVAQGGSCGCIPLVGGLAIVFDGFLVPFGSFSVVLLHALAGLVDHPDGGLSHWVPALCGFGHPLGSFG